MILKCKICGGNLEVSATDKTAVCSYCGRTQTLPRLDDERRLNLYDRANHFRRNNEYDKAMGIYETILSEDKEDAEAYWSLLLCKYGVEYVKDPETREWMPTCNRTLKTSVLADEDYKAALLYAGANERKLYEEEADKLEQIQKGILAISEKEEAYDVFVCYKESDENGVRTMDSVMAQDIYHELTKAGYRVFFARISLENVMGLYEPYIYAALNSARVMLVVGTKEEHFNAVWVKNEWSRFLSMMKENSDKVLIPVYRDMDPYDLPTELAYYQAQDMGKIGFIQDLQHGLQKIFEKERTAAPDKGAEYYDININANVDNLIRRIEAFLNEGDIQKAQEYCEKVLDIKIDEPRVYMAQMRMAYRQQNPNLLQKEENVTFIAENISANRYFVNAQRYAEGQYAKTLEEIAKKNDEFCYAKCAEAVKGEKEQDYTEQLNLIKQFIAGDSTGKWQALFEKTQSIQKMYEEDKKALADIRQQIQEGKKMFAEIAPQKLDKYLGNVKEKYARNQKLREEQELRKDTILKLEHREKICNLVMTLIWACAFVGVGIYFLSASKYKGAELLMICVPFVWAIATGPVVIVSMIKSRIKERLEENREMLSQQTMPDGYEQADYDADVAMIAKTRQEAEKMRLTILKLMQQEQALEAKIAG